MHPRIPLEKETLEERLTRYKKQPAIPIALDHVLSHCLKLFHLYRTPRKWILFKLVIKFFNVYLHIFNRKKAYNVQNLPKKGGIIYINHISSFDPFVLFSSMRQPFCGSLMSWGNGYFSDMLDWLYGLVAFRGKDSREVKVEKMIRSILGYNSFFAIAPEGFVARKFQVHQGFSSIAEVYAVINCKRDVLPFIPVLIRGGEQYRSIRPNFSPIDIHFCPPFFLPREWLKTPEEGGKTPREITDYIMTKLAHYAGQKTFAPNPRMEKKINIRQVLQQIQNSELTIEEASTQLNIPQEKLEDLAKGYKITIHKIG